jgi:hypothetical protein
MKLKGVYRIWSQIPQTKTNKNVHINMCLETFDLWVIAEGIYL